MSDQAPTTPPPMGDNKGPAFNPDVVAALTKDADHISEKAGEFSKKEITNDTEAGELKDFLDAARKTLTHVENRRTAEKKPFLDAGREIDAAFAKIKDVIERAGKLAKAPLVTYLEEQERIAEAKRREEAEAARKKQEEAERDYQLASGIAEDVEPSDNVFLLSRARLPWLFIGLLGGILAALVLGGYEEDLRLYPEKAFFFIVGNH